MKYGIAPEFDMPSMPWARLSRKQPMPREALTQPMRTLRPVQGCWRSPPLPACTNWLPIFWNLLVVARLLLDHFVGADVRILGVSPR